jgi:hypothetical protein
VVQRHRIIPVIVKDEAVLDEEKVVRVRSVADENFLASLVVAIRSHAVPVLVSLRIASDVRVIEIIHERAHGVAVVGGQLLAFPREAWVRIREIRVLPVKGSCVDDEPCVSEEVLGDVGYVRPQVVPVFFELGTLFG